MKITPLEIRQKDFEKKLRGYDKDEVNAFLQSLSNEWERVLEENKDLSYKLQLSEKEVSKLREVESSLFKTLKTAEDTGANVIDQANKAAELHMKETQMNAEALLNESKNKAKAMIEKAETEARHIMEELQDAVKSIQQNHRDIQNQRDLALQELKNLSVTLIEKVERNAEETKEYTLDDYVKRVKKLARESEERILSKKIEEEAPAHTTSTSDRVEPAPEVMATPLAEIPEPKPLTIPDEEDKEDATFSHPEMDDVVEETSSILETEAVQNTEPVMASQEDPTAEEETLVSEKMEEVFAEEPNEVSTWAPPATSRNKKAPKVVSFFDELDTES